MALDIDSQVADPQGNQPNNLNGKWFRWISHLSLTRRILAINIFAVLLLAGSLLYIDGFRERLIDERLQQARTEADIIASALKDAPPVLQISMLTAISSKTDARLRLFENRPENGDNIVYDSWLQSTPRFQIINPDAEGWQRRLARMIDDAIDWVVGAQLLGSFAGFDTRSQMPDQLLLAPDRTHVISSWRLVSPAAKTVLVLDRNARDIRRLVRAERSRLGLILAFAILLSTLMSIFLARTIAKPLKNLALAARQVRLGRAREVIVPRLPERHDEIGELARALSDMNGALQARIDATERFAADVTHELKNPLASLSSAAQTLASVKDSATRKQLLTIIADDVQRLDRLITDVSDLSRIDSQLARTTFETVDIGSLIENLIALRLSRNPERGPQIAFARPKTGSALSRGDGSRLGRVFDNLIDNAFSFSPPGGLVQISCTRARNRISVAIEDEGPGVPASARNRIFDRFHSDREGSSATDNHSGLGLSIAKAIIEAHDGSIRSEPRGKGRSGARFVVTLPALET